jgi:predicted Rossmann fold flavoprotein
MIYHDIIVIGGGASGIMAALTAKDLKKDIAIIEGTSRIGNKILSTGNGRCNISNLNITSPFINYQSNNPDFYSSCLNTYTVEYTKNVFLSLGLPLTELENGKLYPESLQASSVIDIFRLALDEAGIPIYSNCKVKAITKKGGFTISTSNEEMPEFKCKKLLLACGGKSCAKTGSDGSGYKLATNLGHSLITPIPAIVQLKLDYPYLKALSGIKFIGNASIYINNKLIRSEEGEILFTDYGISGPPILQLSRIASNALLNKQTVNLKIDMMPNKTFEELENFIEGHLAIFSHRSISNALIGIVNKKLIPTLIKNAGISNIHSSCYDIEWIYKNKLIKSLKEWDFKCIDTNGFNNAQLTAGGINTKEVTETTLESKIIKDLYFAGEILDVNGDCGGYNLQWAWSSGILVGNRI